jgi:hypothetical protein
MKTIASLKTLIDEYVTTKNRNKELEGIDLLMSTEEEGHALIKIQREIDRVLAQNTE